MIFDRDDLQIDVLKKFDGVYNHIKKTLHLLDDIHLHPKKVLYLIKMD